MNRELIYKNARYAVWKNVPEQAMDAPWVITFPDLTHPTNLAAIGWGEAFLSKRGVRSLNILSTGVNWFQDSDFMPMIAALAESTVGHPVVTYGHSMGAYAAILVAKTLKAQRAFAVCPQFSIDPAIVPFERRWGDVAKEIGPFVHDMNGALEGSETEYQVLFDPTHRDRRQIRLFAKPAGWNDILIPGAGHTGMKFLAEAGLLDDVITATLTGEINAHQARNRIRTARNTSQQYIRRMGNLMDQRDSRLLRILLREAQQQGILHKQQKKWTAHLAYSKSI